MKNKLSIHILLHVPFEGPGCIEKWITQNGHTVTYTRFYEEYTFPMLNDIDLIIVMGGPMGVYDEKQYSWLTAEKRYLHQAIHSGKTVLGICLGAQLVAAALGAVVIPMAQKEIGWFKVTQTEIAEHLTILEGFEEEFTVFQWHGDFFELPVGSKHLLYSELCPSQAFLFNDKVLGLQFHFEVTPETLQEMVENGMSELMESETVQTATRILEQTEFFESNNRKMFQILDYLESKTNPNL